MLKRRILKRSGLGKKKVKILNGGKIPQVEEDPGDQGVAWKQMPEVPRDLATNS